MGRADEFGQDEGGRVVNPDGASPVLLVCEHAGNRIPARYGDLGISAEVLASHVAWDPGALPVAEGLSERLGAPLVVQDVSRLVYDCNRPPESPGAMPGVSEIHTIPGNADLTEETRAERVAAIYRPFERRLHAACEAHAERYPNGAVVTIHTFTPIFHGQPRAVEIGVLHGADARLADALLAEASVEGGLDVRRNAPYGPADGVLHTLETHAVPRRLRHAMIEIRNDLVATPDAAAAMADRLAGWIGRAMEGDVAPSRRASA